MADKPSSQGVSNGGHSDRTNRVPPGSRAIRIGSVLGGLLLAFVLGEVAARICFYQGDPQLDALRQHLANEVPSTARIIGQPYLLYTPAPSFRSGKNQHNIQGYRGAAVSMLRTEGALRVLCLGGSTTYGTGVEDPMDAYPAQLERILNEARPQTVTSVEVINAGLEYATSAELLTHYHFKYHYFRPDLVIINTGGNDALPPSFPEYHPDYSHWREQPGLPRPLSPVGQQLLRSRLLALGIIYALYGDRTGHLSLDRVDGIPPSSWYENATGNAAADLNPAFSHNLNSLIDEIQRDGGKVLLVPYRLAKGYDVPEASFVRQNEQVLLQIGQDRGLPVAPFPASLISPENWVDGSHLNAEGCRQKATHIAEHAIPVLWPVD